MTAASHRRSGGGRAGRGMAVVAAGSVGADRGGGAVGVEANGPAPFMDHDEVMEPAQKEQISEGCRAAMGPGCDVVHVADRWRLVAARSGAVRVPEDDSATQMRRDGL